ncbi:MAG: hypothetical protein A2139_04390 [Desulfobacca sp. RBG_16_60_12]|nr:MAG: hypothetical protein A2139_04390 [Desulfobacca sp. RBG_16_60_12]
MSEPLPHLTKSVLRHNLAILLGSSMLLSGGALAITIQVGPLQVPLASLIAYSCLCLLLPFSVYFLWVLDLNYDFAKTHATEVTRAALLIIFAPLAVSLALALGAIPILQTVHKRALLPILREVTPLKLAVSEACSLFFEDSTYLDRLGTANGYVRIGPNPYVLIWPDDTGDALWFDVADSLSSAGYLCVRPGVLPEVAISDYEYRIARGSLYFMYDNMYAWH